MFPAISIDAGVGLILISSYVVDSFAFTSSFLILAFLLNKTTVTMTRKTVKALITSKITIKTEAVVITAITPLLPLPETGNKMCSNSVRCIILASCYIPGSSHSGITKTTGSDDGPLPSALVAKVVIDTPLLENKQGENGLIFSVLVQINPMQADACIVSVPQISSDTESA